MMETHVCHAPEDTFRLGESVGRSLRPGDVILLKGGLGAGKTLLAKGILKSLEFDIDEVTSPSFTLVNLYRTPRFEVYHIDLWRLDDRSDVSAAIGLDEILVGDNLVVIIEWSEKLHRFSHDGRIIRVAIEGDGDDPRKIEIRAEPSE